MGDELDTVFVAPWFWSNPPDMSTVEWVFNHFDKDKTKIIVTHWNDDGHYRNIFINAARDIYLPRCRVEEFKAEIVTPQSDHTKEAMLELLTKHGMKKLVMHENISHILPGLEQTPNISSCTIWLIESNSKLNSIRQFGYHPLQEAQMEAQKFKKIADEETVKRKSIQDKFVIMTEQAKTNEQKIDHLSQENKQFREENEQLSKENEKLRQNNEQLNHENEQLRQENDQSRHNTSLSTCITFQELEEATETFSDSLKIGEGASGSVYRGTFRGTTVTIKKFKSQNENALEDFRKELVILSMVRHPNLVALMGACSDPPVLVYEYLSNGSLHDHLHHTGRPLLWQTRTRIIAEICLALIYLHSYKPDPIIHGDLRPDNVYLDANFTCKLSDFGPIKQAYTDANLIRTVDPERKFAYMDPRFLKTGKMREESDVYSFGVIILRLITGKTPLAIRETVEESMGNNQFSSMIDESAGKWPVQHAEEMAKIGVKCAQDSSTERPHLVNEVWPFIEGLLMFSDEVMCGRSLGPGQDD